MNARTNGEKGTYPFVLLMLTLLNMAAGMVFISLLPDRVAVHFNAAFEADRLGSPWQYFFFFLFPPLVAAGLIFESRRRGQKVKNRKPLRIMLTFIAVLLAYIGWLMIGWCGRTPELGQKAEAPLYILVCVPLGLMFVVFGNYLPVVKRNGTLGIKTPATLASDYVWAQTHRVMGKVWMGIGAGEILCAFVDTFAGTQFVSFAWLMSGVFSSFAVVPFVTARFKRREEELFAASREDGNPAPHTDENKTTQECPHSKRK